MADIKIETDKERITNAFLQKMDAITSKVFFDYDIAEIDDGTRIAIIKDNGEIYDKLKENKIDELFSVKLEHDEEFTYIIDA